MKQIFLFILVMLSSTANSQTSSERLIEVTYVAGTRGRSLIINVNKDSINYISYEGNEVIKLNKSISDSSFTDLNEIVSKINLQTLGKLEGPTNRRAFDGDWYAEIGIVTTDSTYKSRDFDKCSPMREVQPLILFLQKLSEVNLCSKFFNDENK